MNEISWKPPATGVPAEDLAVWNAAMSHMGAELPMGPDGAVLRLSPISAPELRDDCLSVDLETGGTAYIHLDAFPFKELLDVVFDIADLRSLTGPLHDAIQQGAVQTILSTLPTEIGGTMTPAATVSMDLLEPGSGSEDLIWFAAILERFCPAPAFFSVGIAASDLCRFLRMLTVSPRVALPGLKTRIEKNLFRFVGSASLPSEQVLGLEAGDLIVLDQTPGDSIALQDGHDVFFFETTEDGWRCAAVEPILPQPRSLAMDETSPVLDPSTEDSTTRPTQRLAQLAQTQLTFDLGEVTLSLAELERFQSGTIVSLPESVQDSASVEVSVRIAGVKIATGDLIQIDDRVAVRLNSVLIG